MRRQNIGLRATGPARARAARRELAAPGRGGAWRRGGRTEQGPEPPAARGAQRPRGTATGKERFTAPKPETRRNSRSLKPRGAVWSAVIKRDGATNKDPAPK